MLNWHCLGGFMKRKGVLYLILVLVSVLLMATFAACDGPLAKAGKTPLSLGIDNPYQLGTFEIPADGLESVDSDFKFENVRARVAYSDGSYSEYFNLTKDMLATNNTGKFEEGEQVFKIQYSVEDVVVKGSFKVNLRVRTEQDTMYVLGNGAYRKFNTYAYNPNEKLLTYNDFKDSISVPSKQGYVIKGFVVFSENDSIEVWKNKTDAEIAGKINELSAVDKNVLNETNWPENGFAVKDKMVLGVVWKEGKTQVNFKFNFDKFNISTDRYADYVENIATNTPVKKPIVDNSVIPGWSLSGWYSDEALSTPFNFFSPVTTASVNVYAKWTKNLRNVTLNLNGGVLNEKYFSIVDKKFSEIQDTSTVLKGEILSTGDMVEKIRYNNVEFDQNLLLANFLTNSKETINANNYIYNGKYNESGSTVNKYYFTFGGWFTEIELINEYDFAVKDKMPDNDITLYAKWDVVEATSAQYYEEHLFKNLPNKTNYIVKSDNTIAITGLNDNQISSLELPDKIFGKYITEISANAFVGCKKLIQFSISENSKLQSIGDGAFRFLTNLKRVVVRKASGNENLEVATDANGKSLEITSVGENAFQGTGWLGKIDQNVDNQWVVVGKVIIKYVGNQNIVEVGTGIANAPNFPEGAQILGANAFAEATSLNKIVIGKDIVRIDNKAFANCLNLQNISVEKNIDGKFNLIYIGETAFEDTMWVKEFVKNESYASYKALILGGIYYRYVNENSKVENATIPSGISIIAPFAFGSNKQIARIEFEDESVISMVGKNAFNDTVWFENMAKQNDGFVQINGILIGYMGNDSVVQVPEILNGKTITKISSHAFSGYGTSSILSISIPASIKEIEPFAFVGMTKLNSVSYLAQSLKKETLPRIYETSFNKNATEKINSTFKMFFTVEKTGTEQSIYEEVSTLKNSLYNDFYQSNPNRVVELKDLSVEVDSKLMPKHYIREGASWNIETFWAQANLLSDSENGAKLILTKTDGQVYSVPFLSKYIASGISSAITNVGEKHTLQVVYGNVSCAYDYFIEGRISSLKVVVQNNSNMANAKYFMNSTKFIVDGGMLNFVFAETISDYQLPIASSIGNGLEILNFSTAIEGTRTITFKYKTIGGQEVDATYEILVNAPQITGIKFVEDPMNLDVATTPTLTGIKIKIVYSSFKDGIQNFANPELQEYHYEIINMNNPELLAVNDLGVVVDKKFDTSEPTNDIPKTINLKFAGVTSQLQYNVLMHSDVSIFNVEYNYDDNLVVDEIQGIYGGTAVILGANSRLHPTTLAIPDSIETQRKLPNGVLRKYRLTVVEIAQNAFANDDNLQRISISKNVKTIGKSAFANCVNLQTVLFANSLYSSLQTIENSAFLNCKVLSTIELPQSTKKIGESSFANTALENVDFTKTLVTEIPGMAFKGCTKLVTVELNKDTTSIGSSAFIDCGLIASIKIPATVTYIGDQAFTNTYKLNDIYILGMLPAQLGNQAFGPLNSEDIAVFSIWVLKEKLETYKTSWTYYERILKAVVV